jgi:hypothetical protein
VLPRDLGLAFSTWSLTKLAEYLAATGVAVVSREGIRQTLHDARINWLVTKTWKASTDPGFIAKIHRVLDLYDHPPADGRVICADEFGPLNLQPRPGKAWRPAGHPARLRATYRRTGGVRHMLAALDLGSGQIIFKSHLICKRYNVNTGRVIVVDATTYRLYHHRFYDGLNHGTFRV